MDDPPHDEFKDWRREAEKLERELTMQNVIVKTRAD
jgi:hypothetical protein